MSFNNFHKLCKRGIIVHIKQVSISPLLL